MTRDLNLSGHFHRKGHQDCLECNMGNEEKPLIEQYKVLRTVKFTSERRAMTVVVQDQENKIFVFTKGAKESIFPKLSRYN